MEIENNTELTIACLSALIRKKKLSPLELTEAFLARINLIQPDLNAFITVTADLAISQAKAAEKEILKNRYLGPLHGIPICLKDLFYTEGIPTTAGSKILRRFVPSYAADVVKYLQAAGAVLLGKTNMHEFAYGPTNLNPHYGPVRNPWDPRRMSGGSSGGSSAAVISGMAVAALGTDTGGSIRIPAAACGCVGLKPTYGRVSLNGVIPLSHTLDHVGPLCRCVEDSALMLDAIVGPNDTSTIGGKARSSFTADLRKGLKGLRVGVPKQYFFKKIQSLVRTRVLAAVDIMEQNGADIAEVSMDCLADTARLASDITAAEALHYHHNWLKKKEGQYGHDVRKRLREKLKLPAWEYIEAQQLTRQYAKDFDEVMKSVHILAVPTLPMVAPLINDRSLVVGGTREDVRLALLRLTRPGNLSGLPAISLPCGFSSESLPIGLQLIGRRHDETTLLRAAFAFEQATPWHLMFPSDQPGEKKSSDRRHAKGRPGRKPTKRPAPGS